MDESADALRRAVAVNTALVAAAVLVAAAAMLVAQPDVASRRLERSLRLRIVLRPPVQESVEPASRAQSNAGDPSIASRLACVVGGLAVWLFLSGVFGLVLGIGVAVVGPMVLARLEPRAVRERRQQLESVAPMVADLLAACLAAGASTASSTVAVTDALGDPIASVLGTCTAQIELGADPVLVWGQLADEPALAPIARSILRSADSGAPLSDILRRVADELRQQRRAKLESAARAVGVRAVGPLGVCFLPAFMLLGVVPLIASLIEQMLS